MSTPTINTSEDLAEVPSNGENLRVSSFRRAIGSLNRDERSKATNLFKSIIEQLKENEPQRTNFEDETYRFTINKGETLLHRIVAAFDPEVDDDDEEIEDEDQKNIRNNQSLQAFVKGLVENNSDMLEVKNKATETPLHRAIGDSNSHLVEWMCKDCDPAILSNALAKTTEKKLNCLHLAMQSKLPVKTILYLIEQANEETLTAKTGQGLTPVHLAVQYRSCGRDNWNKVIRALFDKADSALDVECGQQGNQSVFRYHEESRMREYLKSKSSQSRSDGSSHPKGTVPQHIHSSSRRGSNVAEYDSGSKPRPYQYTQTNKPQINGQQPITEHEAKEAKEEEKKREKERMKGQDTNQSSDKGKGEIAIEDESKKRKLEERANEIREFMKLYYLRTRDAEQAVTWLYGNNPEGIQVDFDHFEAEVGSEDAKFRQIIVKDFCEVFEHFRFDPILKSVHFRNLQLEVESNFVFGDNKPFQLLSKDNGRTDIMFLFDWLWHTKGVRRILEVTMEDFDEPHSDEAIEVCLERFKVEVLDWQKVDLCPGVISKIGSHLREVSLHWSGRNAVLRGWSEQYGLVQCPKLIRINLQFPKNLATSNRTMQNISIFKERLSKFRTSNNSIEVTYDHDLNSSWGLPQTYSIQAPIMKNENAGQYNMQEWIRCIDSFSQKIQNIDPKKALSNELLKNIPSYLFKDVVVAVIDDGVDIGNRALRGKIDGGKSFDTGPQGHYRSSTNNHGTVMASMIVRVCPKVKIYVVKLQTYMSESAIQIDIQSAAKAIQAAVDHGVDIISMSWSVKKPDENTAEKNALDQALENAKDKGILLFCSSGDRGDLETETYPGAYSGGTIFRIGAATATGKGREGTPELSRINYLLPGFEIPERKPKGVKADLYTGSSVSTALAAGLAALVRHCIRLGVIWTKTASVEERDRYRVKIDEKKLDSMRTPGEAFKCMNYAFQQFGLNENNHKYIEVWKLLEKDEFISRWKGTQAERLREIAKLGQLFTGIF